jgi:hypothetical protein
MKKLWMTGAALVLATTVWVAGSTAGTGAVLNEYARATDFDASPITTHCENGSCTIPLVVPWTFQLGSVGTPYDAVVTASFSYQATKGVKLKASPQLSDGTTVIPLTDADRKLGPAAGGRSTTLTWVIPGLDANTTYGLFVSVVSIGGPTTYDLTQSNMTLVVEAAPA